MVYNYFQTFATISAIILCIFSNLVEFESLSHCNVTYCFSFLSQLLNTNADQVQRIPYKHSIHNVDKKAYWTNTLQPNLQVEEANI